jgi:uncharacterized protein YcbK (DUF882 family)
MIIDPDANFPNCPNFKHWEAFVTDRPEYKPDKRRFSQTLLNEFNGLPEATQRAIYINLCQTIALVQFARDSLGFSIPSESVYRSQRLNKLVGSSSTNHTSGYAFDPRLEPAKLKQFLNFFAKHGGGVGQGTKQGHIDLKHTNPPRRWPYGG